MTETVDKTALLEIMLEIRQELRDQRTLLLQLVEQGRKVDMDTMTVGERIRTTREKLGLTQVQLAKKVGVSRGAIYQWETDATEQIRSDKLHRLAAVLGLDPAALSPFGGAANSRTSNGAATEHPGK